MFTYVVTSCETHAWHVDAPYYPEYDDDNAIIRDGIVQTYGHRTMDIFDGKYRHDDENEHYADVPDGIVLNVSDRDNARCMWCGLMDVSNDQPAHLPDCPALQIDDLPF